MPLLEPISTDRTEGLYVLQFADVEVGYDDSERIGRLAGLVDELRTDETVVCGSGDNLGPGVLSAVTRGRQSLDLFRAVEADVETVGNHDFDHGLDSLVAVVRESPQTWVCANAFRDEGADCEEGFEPWTVLERGDQRIGVVGVAHPETAEMNPNAAGVEFSDPVPAVEVAVDALRRRAVDWIVVLSHLGDDTELARAVDVDAVLGGHDHEPTIDRVDDTLVCRPGGSGRSVLEVASDGSRLEATHHDVADAPIDRDVASKLRARIATAGLDEVVGTIEDAVVCDLEACKRAESRIGNLVTDAYEWRTGADVGLNTGGGFRRRPPLAGDVTAFDLVSVTPYDRPLQVLTVDGRELRAALRQLSLVEAPDDLSEWQFGHVSGAELVWDDAAEELRSARVGGEAIDSDATYEVATSEFFVENDALFPALDPDQVVASHGPQYETVVEYARERGIDPALEGRIHRPALSDDAVPPRDWPHSPE